MAVNFSCGSLSIYESRGQQHNLPSKPYQSFVIRGGKSFVCSLMKCTRTYLVPVVVLTKTFGAGEVISWSHPGEQWWRRMFPSWSSTDASSPQRIRSGRSVYSSTNVADRVEPMVGSIRHVQSKVCLPTPRAHRGLVRWPSTIVRDALWQISIDWRLASERVWISEWNQRMREGWVSERATD